MGRPGKRGRPGVQGSKYVRIDPEIYDVFREYSIEIQKPMSVILSGILDEWLQENENEVKSALNH